mmetsp:Transcript_940/g.1312  ORF Transcript_940/g.1312 Transcript_940/m.1312 type:complete len:601 (+) Transcript_940:176-1978(+)|eukprot:CAMPEP_0167748854 /NCGR_PEP_ID=MMETSP0110_2-20121227/5070_1 /TAXON_ID=629695 /ORGANISM="Gymnochlora sp., Strain CCMP2014" /LENGTH=600 /DNA_ID=CAMNT_0007633917 /DNA_START=101 /DNA_END=1903 /DNA_ORIENTATION=+
MSDVKDILGLSRSKVSPAAPKSSSKKDVNPLTKGLAREVRNLLDNNMGPGIGIALQAQQFKAKRSRKTSWKLQKIRSSARRSLIGKPVDDLEIFHWVKIHNVPDYRFAKWNKSLKMLQYTDAEYEQHLKHPRWSKEETDKLFSLCKECDLRFLVIHDRFNPILSPIPLAPVSSSTHEGYPWAKNSSKQPPSVSAPDSSVNTDSMTVSPGEKVGVVGDEKKESKDPSVTDDPNKRKETLNPIEAVSASDSTVNPQPDTKIDNTPSGKAKDETEKANDEKDCKKTTPNSNGTKEASIERTEAKLNAENLDSSMDVDVKETSPYFPRLDLSQGYRSMEELKSRYYDCQKLLLKARCVAEGGKKEDVLSHPLFQNVYDGEYEKIRREQMELLFNRTADQEKQITTTQQETRKLDQKIRRVKKQLDQLKKNPRAALSMLQRAKKNVSGSSKNSGEYGSSKASVPVNVPLAEIPKECIVSDIFEQSKEGVSLRSEQKSLPDLRGRISKQLENKLMELDFDTRKPFSTPTSKVWSMYKDLQKDIVSMLHLSRYVLEKEKECDRLRQSLRAQNKNVPPPYSRLTGTGLKRELSYEKIGGSDKKRHRAK